MLGFFGSARQIRVNQMQIIAGKQEVTEECDCMTSSSMFSPAQGCTIHALG
jgi:hypothetical protein